MHFGITINKEEDKAYKDGKEYQGTYASSLKQSYTYKSGDYAPENYLLEKYPENSKYSSNLTKKKAGNSVQGSSYTIGKLEDEEVITKLIFDGTTEKENYVKSYWLASTGVYFGGSDYVYFALGIVTKGAAGSGRFCMVHSIGRKFATEFAIRPIISLKSGVTVEDIQRCDGEEIDWTGDGPNEYLVNYEVLDYGKILE